MYGYKTWKTLGRWEPGANSGRHEFINRRSRFDGLRWKYNRRHGGVHPVVFLSTRLNKYDPPPARGRPAPLEKYGALLQIYRHFYDF